MGGVTFMKLYLVQHGKAKREEEDPEKALSAQGVEESKKVASHLSRIPVKVDHIFHSDKLRARQTVEIFARQLNAKGQVGEIDGLAPKDDPLVWKARLGDETEDLMLVGHLPHLSRLASLLLCGEPEKEIVSFTNSGVLCLEKDRDQWQVRWVIVPHMI